MFKIAPHFRLQEWVAEDKGYFRAEGLQYEFSDSWGRDDPGKTHKVAYDIGWLSQIFNKGHRIRVTIASTGAPLYEPNPQTGKPLAIDFPKDAIAATNTIHHNKVHTSRILAPSP